MGDCLTIPQANSFLAKDSNRITGRIAHSLAINNPYVNVISTDTFHSGISDSQRSVIQGAVAPVLSQANPQWGAFQCNKVPTNIVTGSQEFQYTPESHFEMGPPICVTQAFSAFKNAIKQTESAIIDHVQTLWTSWLRYRLMSYASTKVSLYHNASGTTSFQDILAQGFGTNFKAGVTPNSPVSFKFLKYLANYLRHSLLAGGEFMFGSGMEQHYRFISDQNTIDNIRAEIVLDLRAGTQGGYKDSYEGLMGYSFDGPYRGLAFGVDESIIRASGVNADGTLDYVEPFLAQNTTNGVQRVVNPSWLTAPFQVSFMFAKGSFVREIPEEFLGEGMTTFQKQFWAGDVRWHNQKDNQCNMLGNTGFHLYQLAAALRPERPQFVIPILHTRCADDLGLVPCTPQAYYSQSM